MGSERGHFVWFEEVTSEQRPDGWKEPAMGRFGEKWSRLGHDKCKGPEGGKELACSQDRRKAGVAGGKPSNVVGWDPRSHTERLLVYLGSSRCRAQRWRAGSSGGDRQSCQEASLLSLGKALPSALPLSPAHP